MPRRPEGVTSVGFSMPRYAHDLLKSKATEQDCSVSWLVCDAVMEYLGLEPEEFFGPEWKKIPKTKTERRQRRVKDPDKSKPCSAGNIEIAMIELGSDNWVTIEQLCKVTGYSYKTVRLALKRLVADNIIVYHRKGLGGTLQVKLKGESDDEALA